MNSSPVMVNSQQRRSPLRGALAWLLMMAVLFGQGLGAVHSISHGVPGGGGHAHAHAPAHAHATTEPLHSLHATAPACDHGDAPGLSALFDHAPDEPGCRLYDQLLQAGPLMPVSTVLAVPVRARTLPPPDIGVRLAAPAAVYLARGPPQA
jgi:hypothetical protein